MVRAFRRFVPQVVVVVLAALGAGGPAGVAADEIPGDFRVISVDPDGAAPVPVDGPLVLTFSDRLARGAATTGAFRVVAAATGEEAAGSWRSSGARAWFLPRLGSAPDLSDGGLLPGTRYEVRVDGAAGATPLASRRGLPLAAPFAAPFETADAESPALFSGATLRGDGVPGVVSASPREGTTRSAGRAVVSVRLSAPLDPRTVVPENAGLHLAELADAACDLRLRGALDLRQAEGWATLRFVSETPLPRGALLEFRAGPGLRGLRGDPVDTAGEGGLLTWFRTADSTPRTHTLPLRFDGTDRDQDGGPGVDRGATSASFDGLVPGAVAAGFMAGGGDGALGDFDPEGDVVLSTDSPSASNGTFPFRSVRIREGVTVTLSGSLPARILSRGDIVIEGTLRVSGGRGDDGESASDGALPGGAGGPRGPGGGAGGVPYTGPSWAASRGGSGAAAPVGGAGGEGGTEPVTAFPGFGGGGGGGGGAVPGGDGEMGRYPTRSSWDGLGGVRGGAGGMEPDSLSTRDGRDFHLLGAGGGGGGAGGNSHEYPKSKALFHGAAGGGGGGGALLLQAAGSVRLPGSVEARGGDGGHAGSGPVGKYGGAAGGGGGGGTVAIYAGGRLDLDGGTLDVSGGRGGSSSGDGWPGRGGDGGAGRIRLEDGDGVIDGLGGASLLPDFTAGTFEPRAGDGDPPTVFVSTWFDAGVPGAEVLPLRESDFVAFLPAGAAMVVEIQAAATASDGFRADDGAIDGATGESLDPARASRWVTLRDGAGGAWGRVGGPAGPAWRFFRVRFRFLPVDGSRATDPRPHVEELRLRFRY